MSSHAEAAAELAERTPTEAEYADLRALRKFVGKLRSKEDPPPRIIVITRPPVGVASEPGNCISNALAMVSHDPTSSLLWGYKVWLNTAGGLRAALHVIVATEAGVYLDVTECPGDDSTLFVPSSTALTPAQQAVAIEYPRDTRLGAVVGGAPQYVQAVLTTESERATVGLLVTDPQKMALFQIHGARAYRVHPSGEFEKYIA
jgi:hypothetical protein